MSQFIEMFGDPVSWQTDTSLPTLNDTVNVISGFPFDSEKFDTEGVGTPLIRIRDIQRGYSETFTTEVFDKQYRIKKYELLVGMDGMFDIARWQSDEAALNQRVCCLRMKGSENDTFIQYLVQPILKHIENGTNATTVKHISTKQINGIRVPIASHEQKNKFAMIANQADKSGFDGRKSQFIEMFGGGNWPQKTLGEVGSFTRGGGFLKSDFVEHGIPCIHYGQIHTKFGPFITSHITEISSDLESKTKFASKGDLVIAITSEDTEGSCKSTAWLGDYPVAVGGHAAIYKHSMNPLYMSFFFKSTLFNYAKIEYVHGTKVFEIKPDDIAKILVPCPPMSLQNQFSAIAEQSDKSGFELRKSIDAIDAVIKSLINS